MTDIGENDDIEKELRALAHIDTEIFSKTGKLEPEKLKQVLENLASVMRFSDAATQLALCKLEDMTIQIETVFPDLRKPDL